MNTARDTMRDGPVRDGLICDGLGMVVLLGVVTAATMWGGVLG